MVPIITLIHVIVCFFLVIIVLLQHGKGADIGATFGGGGNTVFGTDGPVPLLNKVTTAAAVIFMLTSITLAYFSANTGNGSVMEAVTAPANIPVPIEEPLETGPVKIPMPDDQELGQTEGAPAEFPIEENSAQ